MTKPFDPIMRQVTFRGRTTWEVDCRAWPAAMRRMNKPQRRRFPTKDQAIAWRREILQHEASGAGPDPGPLPVSDLCARYLSSVKKSDRSPVTYTNYKRRLKTFVTFLDREGVVDVRAVTVETIELYRLELFDRLSPGSVGQALIVVSGMFSWARRMRVLDRNPVDEVEIPRQQTNRRALTDDERRILLEYARPRWQPVWVFMLATGLRRAEMQGLTVASFELDSPAPFVRVLGKGRKERTVPLVGVALRIARDLVARAHDRGREQIIAVGYARFGEVWTEERNRINRQLRDEHGIEDALGTDLTLHNLRHDCATRLANDAVTPLPEVAALLGHASISTTMGYVHRDERKLRTGLEALGGELEGTAGEQDWYKGGISDRRREGKS